MKKKEIYLSIFSISCVLIVWHVVTLLELLPPITLPSFKLLIEGFKEIAPRLPQDIKATLVDRILPGYLIGCSVGIFVGFIMGRSKIVESLLDPIVELGRPVPVLGLIPLFIIWFGIGNFSKIVLLSFGCFIVMVICTREAIRSVPLVYVYAAYALGANSFQVSRSVVFPAIIPHLFSGFRVAMAMSFGYDVAAELMGAPNGLGYLLIMARRYLATNIIIVVIIIMALLSLGLDRIIRVIGRYLTRWEKGLK